MKKTKSRKRKASTKRKVNISKLPKGDRAAIMGAMAMQGKLWKHGTNGKRTKSAGKERAVPKNTRMNITISKRAGSF